MRNTEYGLAIRSEPVAMEAWLALAYQPGNEERQVARLSSLTTAVKSSQNAGPTFIDG